MWAGEGGSWREGVPFAGEVCADVGARYFFVGFERGDAGAGLLEEGGGEGGEAGWERADVRGEEGVEVLC